MKILVTGATGFLGHHVVKQLLDQDLEPILAIRDSSRLSILHKRIPKTKTLQTVELDLENFKPPESIRPHVVIHCAAYGVNYGEQNLHTAIQVNVNGSAVLFEWASKTGVEKFIHVGTCYEYGASENLILEEHPLRPVGLYGSSKAAASIVLQERARSSSTHLTIFRPFVFYGPWERDYKLFPQILSSYRTRTPLELTSAQEIRDYLSITDVARALTTFCILSSQKSPSGEIFNLCSGNATKISDFIRECAETLGIPDLMQFGKKESRSQQAQKIVGDPSKWKSFCKKNQITDLCKITPIQETIRQALELEDQNGEAS